MTIKRYLNVVAAGSTDVGRKRQNNQDYYLIEPDLGLYVVADGMGGHDAGEQASRQAVEMLAKIIAEYYQSGTATVTGFNVRSPISADRTNVGMDVAARAVRKANDVVFNANLKRGYDQGRGMGTTLAGVWLPDGESDGIIFHVGDCRVYLYRQGTLNRLTRDHSLYQEWVELGGVGVPPKKNIVLRAIGPWTAVDAEFNAQVLQAGDIIMICSDGLTDMLSDAQIKTLLEKNTAISLQDTCREFIENANAQGGDDNVTLVIAKVGEL